MQRLYGDVIGKTGFPPLTDLEKEQHMKKLKVKSLKMKGVKKLGVPKLSVKKKKAY